LLEMVAALVVFALAFAVLMELAAGSMRATRRAATETEAALWAQSKLDAVGVGEELREGGESGRFGEKFRWELAVQKQDAPAAEGGAIEQVPVDLYRLELKLMWDESGRERETRFVTLRAVQPKV
jgi:general secretion pathway protein I